MAKKQLKNPTALPQKSRQKESIITISDSERRDKDTNVYIATDAEVAALKAWSEFCKL